MAKSTFGLRKQRTRQHIIADLSVHHLEGFILEEGHTVQRMTSDYGYDLMMSTFDADGYAEPWPVYFQLKAIDSLQPSGANYIFDLDIRDYNLWIHEEMPVILVLFDATRRKAYWLCIQKYFDKPTVADGTKKAKTVRVHFSKRNVLNRSAIQKMRDLKSAMRRPNFGVIS